jgi:hypothetical protein
MIYDTLARRNGLIYNRARRDLLERRYNLQTVSAVLKEALA